MPEPIEFQAIQGLQTRLRAIAVSAGYHNDVQSVAVKLDPNGDAMEMAEPGGPRPLIILESLPEDWRYGGSGQITIAMPVRLYWVQKSDPTSDDSRMLTFFRAAADVERTVEQGNRLGVLGTDCRLTGRTPAADKNDSTQAWTLVDLILRVTRQFGEPDR